MDEQSLFLVDQGGNVSAYAESEAFLKDHGFFKELIDRDLIVRSGSIAYERIVGEWNMPIAFPPLYISDTFTINRNTPEDIVIPILLNPDAPNLRLRTDSNMQVFPSASEKTEEALVFLRWLYESGDNRRLLSYGQEGVEYELTAGGEVRYLKERSERHITYTASYGAPEDMLREEGISEALWSAYLDIGPKEAYLSPAVITPFDPSPVQEAYDNVIRSMGGILGVLSIRNGRQDISHLQSEIDSLKRLGLDILVEEYQRQLDEAAGK
ncbi:MAG: hypothetical protein ACOX8S_07035 [Christensenellales bacterium]